MSQATRKSRYDDVYHEIAQYQQIIDSLRAEVSEYKSNLGNILSDNIQYEQVIESLVDEVTQYKNKRDSVISERAQKKNTELPRQEVYEDKNTHAQTSSGAAQDELILHSLGTDIAKLKKDLESITVEV